MFQIQFFVPCRSRRKEAFRTILLLAVIASLAATSSPSNSQPPPSAPESPREFYNAGTGKLREGKLREAEALFQTALAAQQPALQPPALFNLGHVRFSQGAEELKKGPSAQAANARAQSALERAGQALANADEALAGTDVQRLVDSYLNGRGARRDLLQATRLVRRALQTYGAALAKWERASGDFKSALELNPADADARANADTVDRAIAKLIDSIQQMQQAMSNMGRKKEELGDKMKQLKGRIPEQDMPPGAPGEDEEEEDQPQGQQPGQQEAPASQGDEIPLPPELAGWLLESFKLDNERRLPMGQQDTAEPKNRNRKPW